MSCEEASSSSLDRSPMFMPVDDSPTEEIIMPETPSETVDCDFAMGTCRSLALEPTN